MTLDQGVMHPRWKIALRCLPLCLLAVVLWREKRGRSGCRRAPVGRDGVDPAHLVVFLPLKAARWRVALTDPPPFRRVLAATIEGLLANAAIGFAAATSWRAARCARAALAADYACTWAERGAEVLALAALVFVTAL